MLPPESAKSDWSIRVGPSGLWSTLGARMRLYVLDWPDGRNALPWTQSERRTTSAELKGTQSTFGWPLAAGATALPFSLMRAPLTVNRRFIPRQ